MNIQEATQSYLDSIYVMSHSHSTLSSYKLAITNQNNCSFRDFLQQRYNINEFDLIDHVKNEKLDIYKILNEFVVFLDSQNYKPKSILTRMAGVKGYLRYIGLRINAEDCKQIVRIPKVIRQREEPITKELIAKLQRNLPPRLQTIVLVLSASGIRIGELVRLE